MLTDLPDFALLQSEFQGDLVLPSDEGYEKSLKRWASTAQKKAGLVAFVKVEEDIIAILRFVRKNSLDLAVKCGGHSVSGASSSEGGVVIDLSRYFKTVTVDEKARVAHVGGGATWRDVDLATFPHGLASVAGTVSHTGVGGLILGGGYGYLAGEHGLVIDNLVGARVISADGEMHNCSEEENQDLFWAIRGGGGNFGIVTSFSLTIHPQIPQVFIADLHFPGEKVEEFSVAVKQWLELSTKKEMLFVFLEDRGTGPVIAAHCFHNGNLERGKEQFKRFYDLGRMVDNTRMVPYLSLNQAIDDVRPFGTGLYWQGGIFPSVHEHPDAGVKLWQSYLEMYNAEDQFKGSSFVILEFHHTDKLMERRPDGMAFIKRDKEVIMLVGLGWGGVLGHGPFEKARSYAKKIAASGAPQLKDGETKTEIGYSNWESERPTGYERSIKLFGDNYPRLQGVKAKYDPSNMFNKWYPVEPKSSDI